VSTGNLADAGTEANIQMMLVGQRGDTGYRQLLKPLPTDLSRRPFQPGQVNATTSKNLLICLLYIYMFIFLLYFTVLRRPPMFYKNKFSFNRYRETEHITSW